MEISIIKFLSKYYGISLDAGFTYSHKEIIKCFKFLEVCSLDYVAKNMELVQRGRIIYVVDSYGKVLPYSCPDIIISSLKENEDTDICEEDDAFIIDELSDMPTYLVRQLLSKYKDKPSFYKVIRKELVCRGVYQSKKHKIDKEIKKMELEESEFYDKFQRRRKIKYNES